MVLTLVRSINKPAYVPSPQVVQLLRFLETHDVVCFSLNDASKTKQSFFQAFLFSISNSPNGLGVSKLCLLCHCSAHLSSHPMLMRRNCLILRTQCC